MYESQNTKHTHTTIARRYEIHKFKVKNYFKYRKDDLLILWTDYFKPVHLEKYPDLHDTFWKAAKLCSACKVEVSVQHAEELMAAVENIHNIFWSTKDRDVTYYKAS